MKILSAAQIREVDAFTIMHEPIASIDLMERASEAFTSWFVQRFSTDLSIAIVCGTGNNGGDGLAVARLLIEAGYNVKVFVTGITGSEDFMINYDRLQRLLDIQTLDELNKVAFHDDVMIDAIFGSGLNRPPEGNMAKLIDAFNHAAGSKIAIDVASGLYCDQPSKHSSIVQAEYTVSFQIPKLVFFLPENEPYVGQFHMVDIGLDLAILKRMVTNHHMITSKFVRPLMQKRKIHSHKGTFGKGALVTGSYGKIGASVLASGAFMRTGGGLLMVYSPACGYTTLQTCVPEAMVSSCGERMIESYDEQMVLSDATGIGPGIGKAPATKEVLSTLLKNSTGPVVIDADALNLLSEHREMMELIPTHSILTPHPREFERLFGTSEDDFSRLERLRKAAVKLQTYIVLKGANTATATPEGDVFFNSTGNPGMATAGSGDVLTGIITSLLCQGQTPFHAAVFGVYLHGLAGDLAKEEMGENGMLATDIINNLPFAFLALAETD